MTSNATADRPCPMRLGLHRGPAHIDGDLPLGAGDEFLVATPSVLKTRIAGRW